MGARLYDALLGRFLQVDPVFGGSCNPYDYTCQDPVNGSDLTGQCFLGICLSTVVGWAVTAAIWTVSKAGGAFCEGLVEAGPWASAACGATLGGVISLAYYWHDTSKRTVRGYIGAFVKGAAAGAVAASLGPIQSWVDKFLDSGVGRTLVRLASHIPGFGKILTIIENWATRPLK